MLRAKLDINGWPLEDVYIRRLEHLKGEDQVHQYSIGTAKQPEMTTFEHRYDRGALECLRAGLTALLDAHPNVR